MDYSQVATLFVDIVKAGLPIGIMALLCEVSVNLFLGFVFPKKFKGGI